MKYLNMSCFVEEMRQLNFQVDWLHITPREAVADFLKKKEDLKPIAVSGRFGISQAKSRLLASATYRRKILFGR